MDNLHAILSYLEETIDPDHFKEAVKVCKQAMRFEPTDRLCVGVGAPIEKQFPGYSIEEIHEDMAKMLCNELCGCIAPIEAKDAGLPMIRANYGVGTLPSAFGLKSHIVNGNMPWVEHASKEDLQRIIEKGVPEGDAGYGKKVIETYEFYNETLAKYPKCKEVIKLYHPDFQGSLDVAHLMYGSDIYIDMYEDPDFVHALLELVTDTYIDRMKKVKTYLNDEEDGFHYHWGTLYPGRLTLRNDSAVNLSPDMYEEFVQPYDDKIMNALGKSSVHFCGRADQIVFKMAESENILGLNFGYMPNVEFGEAYLDFIAPVFTEKKIANMGYVITKEELDAMDFTKYGTGISFKVYVSTMEEAREIRTKCGW